MPEPDEEWETIEVREPPPEEDWETVEVRGAAPRPAGALRQATAAPWQKVAAEEAALSGQAFAQGVGQGATFGFSDEAVAGHGALSSAVLDKLPAVLKEQDYVPLSPGYTGPRAARRGYGAPVDTRSTYQRMLDEERARIAQLREGRESAMVAGDILGTVATSTLLPPLAGAQRAALAAKGGGLALAGRTALGGAEGLALGAVEGAGRSEGDRLEGAGGGAAIGGGVGVALPLLGAAARKVPAGVVNAVTWPARKLYGALVPEQASEALGPMLRVGTEGAEARKALLASERGAEPLAAEIGQGLTAQREYLDEAMNVARTSMKGDVARKMMEETGHAPPEDIMQALSEPITALRSVVEEAASNGAAFPTQGTSEPRKLLKLMNTWEGEILEGLSRGDAEGAAKAFEAADKIKRQAQRVTANAQDRGFHQALDTATEPLRQTLESPELWGPKLGQEQRALNESWRRFLQREPAFKPRFLTNLGDVPVPGADPYGLRLAGDEGKLAALIGGADRAGANQALHVLERGTQESQSLLERLGSMYQVPRATELATKGRGVADMLSARVGDIRRGAELRGAAADVLREAPFGKTVMGSVRALGRVEAAADRMLSAIEALSPETVTRLQTSAQRGPQEYAAAIYTLQQQDVALREALRAKSDADQEQGGPYAHR